MVKKQGKGDCYKVHAEAMINGSTKYCNQIVYLCHGTVYHESVGWHGHCWLEQAGFVYDISNGHDISCLKTVYYALGYVRDVYRYTAEEVKAMLLKHDGHYGAWEGEWALKRK